MSSGTVDRFFNENGQVIVWPKKRADKDLVLEYLATKFEANKTYHENEVNEILKKWHTFADWPLLRRELIESGLMQRNRDGTEYSLVLRVRLVDINVERDAPMGVKWLNGIHGVETFRLMGNVIADDWQTNIDEQREVLAGIINDSKGLSFMVEADGKIVGIVETHPDSTPELPGPSIHIMLGDHNARGRGIGYASQLQQIDKLKQLGYKKLYSRAQTINVGSNNLLTKLGFEKYGEIYVTAEGLKYQNYILFI